MRVERVFSVGLCLLEASCIIVYAVGSLCGGAAGNPGFDVVGGSFVGFELVLVVLCGACFVCFHPLQRCCTQEVQSLFLRGEFYPCKGPSLVPHFVPGTPCSVQCI